MDDSGAEAVVGNTLAFSFCKLSSGCWCPELLASTTSPVTATVLTVASIAACKSSPPVCPPTWPPGSRMVGLMTSAPVIPPWFSGCRRWGILPARRRLERHHQGLSRFSLRPPRESTVRPPVPDRVASMALLFQHDADTFVDNFCV
jgi:hypothetical protein